MDCRNEKEILALCKTIVSAEEKKQQLLVQNREAARALLSSIPSVSYVTQKKNESAE